MKRLIVLFGLIFLVGVFSAFTVPQEAPVPEPQVTTQPQLGPQQQPAATPPQDVSASMLNKVGEVLLVFLVLSVVFESALTPLFNWRVFRERFDGKGLKTPIIVGLAFLVFWGYDLDIINDILVAVDYLPETNPRSYSLGGQVLTALLIAGGSSGIFTIFKRLGIRNPTVSNDAPATPPPANGDGS